MNARWGAQLLVLSAALAILPSVAAEPEPPAQEAGQVHELTPPTGTILINGGADYTNTTAVTLTLSATDDSGRVAQMQFSNDNLTYTDPEPYKTTKSWSLPPGEGLHTVYAKFSDPSGNWSQPTSDAIILDTIPPVVTITNPTDGQIFGAQ